MPTDAEWVVGQRVVVPHGGWYPMLGTIICVLGGGWVLVRRDDGVERVCETKERQKQEANDGK